MKTIRFILFGILLCKTVEPLQAETPQGLRLKEYNPTNPPASEPPFPNQDYPELLRSAEKLYKATLYDQAIPIYSMILQAIEKKNILFSEDLPTMLALINDVSKDILSDLTAEAIENDELNLCQFVRYRLGQSYFYLDDFGKASQCFSDADRQNSSAFKDCPEQPTFLYAICCRHLKNYQKAIELLKGQAALSHSARFELAVNYFLSNDHSSATIELTELEAKCHDKPLETLIQFYLCRINIINRALTEAAQRLEAIQLQNDDLHQFELNYLLGEVAFHLHDYQAAVDSFTKALPRRKFELAAWYCDTLYYLGWSHLKIADDQSCSPEQQKFHFNKSEEFFSKLHSIQPKERIHLAMAQYYLARWSRLKEKAKYDLAISILCNRENFTSPEAQTQALLLQAEAMIPEGEHKFSPIERGSNILQENLLKNFNALSDLIENQPETLSKLKEPQKLLYLYGMMASHLAKISSEPPGLDTSIEKILNQALVNYPSENFADACLNFLATFHFKKENYNQAESHFNRIVAEHPNSQFADEALYWSAICAERLKKEDSVIKKYRKKLFENYATSSFAPAAYFQFYTYREYLQGDRNAVKHLLAFKKIFPNSSLLINSYYLIGLDYKRERKSSTGSSLRKKNLNEAISVFYKAEQLFDELYGQHMIPEDQLEHYVMIRYRALLERALANQAIAEDSHAAKREIYFQYAQDLFIQIYEELSNNSSPLIAYLTKNHPFPNIQEESLCLLIQNYLKLQNFKAAEQYIDTMIAKYNALKIFKNYHLSRIYYEKGMLLMKQQKYDQAWIAFMQAEKSGGNIFLSTDQKLDLWIQESECCKALNQTDKAMLILSKVINDNTISSLRVKAMYLRATIYALQNRHELARKQLAATASKGGEWALKAKLKLEEDYGF
ncbi:MAG: tetratricopeptide repeat protein [Parachlamydiaceae bacterium]|nr:tetratricopeptide repeat protein [Parachlamydiaceae bacterium]